MANPITIPLIIQFLDTYDSTDTSLDGLQNYLLISENTAKNFRSGRSFWVNETIWSRNAKDEVKAVFDRLCALAQNYNGQRRLMQPSTPRELAFDEYLCRDTSETPWLSELFKPKFCSSPIFTMPSFTFFLKNYIYKQLCVITPENILDCHSDLVKFMKENNLREDIIADFCKVYNADLNTIAHFLASKAFNWNLERRHVHSSITKQEADNNDSPLLFPFYIDSVYVNMIYEQLLTYTENELPLPLKPKDLIGQTMVDINGLHVEEQPLAVSDHWKMLMIIHAINNSSLDPIHMYNCLQQQPKKNLVFVEGTFRLTGIYDITGNLIDNAAYEPNKNNLHWHLEYVNTGVDNTDFSKLQDDQYICSYARGRDTIYQISMNLSGDKFILSYRHITHLVKRFGTFKLKVLGHLIRDSQDPTTLSIKPLAVFHES